MLQSSNSSLVTATAVGRESAGSQGYGFGACRQDFGWEAGTATKKVGSLALYRLRARPKLSIFRTTILVVIYCMLRISERSRVSRSIDIPGFHSASIDCPAVY